MNTSLRVLAFSSSRVGGGGYLEAAAPVIASFLGMAPLQIAFVPFAAIDDYDSYGEKVAEGLAALPHQLQVAHPHNAAAVLKACDVVMIGGGNTFKLLHDLYEHKLVQLIQERVSTGTPYIGWSAGSNLTGLSIRTTNDMPIVQPQSFEAFGFFPFQINPHYFNETRTDFHGETRDQRLEEFCKLNATVSVYCLPEGTWLQATGGQCFFGGKADGAVMTYSSNQLQKKTLASGEITFV